MLRLTTLGGMSLRAFDAGSTPEDLMVPRRGLAVLALAATGPANGVTREMVVAYLWPESDESRARAALRQTLFALRRDLARPDLLLGGPDLVLNPTILTSDVREFQIARAAGDLERVVELYNGPFLEGFHLGGSPEFDRWVDRQRTEYATCATTAIEALARGAALRGDQTAAAEWWRRLVAADPLNSRLVRELMMAQASSGNTAGALRLAETHERLMRDELGAASDGALRELAGRIRRGEPLSVGPAIPPTPSPSPILETRAPGPGGPQRFRERLAAELAACYVIEEAVETGGYGGVRLLRARDRRYDRRVMLKVLHPALASQIDGERFVREIRLTGRLFHPHILPLLDSGEVAGRPWFSVPLPDGETLRARLSRELTLPLRDAVSLTLELGDALGYAHSAGIVHRDVCPENVIMAGGHALLTNLGVARALDTAAGAALTVTGVLVGSPAYMSPEQAEGARAVDGRTDIYALATVLFEMLTGEPLFSGPTPESILAKRASESTPDMARLAGVPLVLRGVLRRALERDPDRRYHSVGEFGSALSRALAAETFERGLGWKLLSWLGIRA
jgi:DNA-binding SARP family transcriptional activator